jgi:hypothetical protein
LKSMVVWPISPALPEQTAAELREAIASDPGV